MNILRSILICLFVFTFILFFNSSRAHAVLENHDCPNGFDMVGPNTCESIEHYLDGCMYFCRLTYVPGTADPNDLPQGCTNFLQWKAIWQGQCATFEQL